MARRSHEEIRAFVAQRASTHEPTPTEKLLADALGDGWIREHPIEVETKNGGHYFYVLDLFHPQARLCVEVDGHFHYQRGRLRGRDRRRGTRLATIGIMTIRVTNRDVMQGLAQVIEHITTVVRERTQ